MRTRFFLPTIQTRNRTPSNYFPFVSNTQGMQHYVTHKYLQNQAPIEERKRMDQIKEKLCKEAGISLIKIPFWWDRKQSSLAATIHSQRPDLFPEVPMGTPIPIEEPTKQGKKGAKNRTRVMTAMEWDLEDPTGW
jgi:hypothetical protein